MRAPMAPPAQRPSVQPARPTEPLRALFSPASVALIGASVDPARVGHQILRNLLTHQFNGSIYPVNPHRQALLGLPCFPSIDAVPGPVDLAVVAVPAASILAVVDACGKKGVKGLVVITAGFRETGAEGARLEAELGRLVEHHGMRMVGPNCMGIINADPAVRLNASFAPGALVAGRTAIMSQSGALGIAILEYAASMHLGVARFASLGNKTNVSGNDLLQLWEDDPAVGQILMYLEGFGNPRNFVKIARRVSRKKPILVVKSGRTARAAKAAGSHTGALATVDTATDALFDQCGVVRAETMEELFDVALAVSEQPLPAGNRVAIVTNSGGPAIMAIDAMDAAGLRLAEFSDKTRAALRAVAVPEASVDNPVDLLAAGDATGFGKALDIVLGDVDVDAVIAIYTPPMVTRSADVAQAIADANARWPAKTLLSVFLGRGTESEAFLRLVEGRVPAYSFPESAVRAIGAMVRLAESRARPEGTQATVRPDAEAVARALGGAGPSMDGWLPQAAALDLVAAYGLPVAPHREVADAEGAARAAREIGFPVVLKAEARGLVHKSDVQGVVLGLGDEDAVRRAFDQMRMRVEGRGYTPARALVMKQVPPGRELLLGATQDPTFGPLVAAGLGGVFAEVLKDVAFRLAPPTDQDATRLLRSLKAYSVLRGVRGEAPADEAALVEALQRLGRLAYDLPQVAEIDLNPVIVRPHGQGLVVVDARVRVRPQGPDLPPMSKRPSSVP